MLSQVPGNLGYYLGLTGTQMNAADAVFAGFADYYIPKDEWFNVIEFLEQTGDFSIIKNYSINPGKSHLSQNRKFFDNAFKFKKLSKIVNFLSNSENRLAQLALQKIEKNCPLAMTYTIEMLSILSPKSTIEDALNLEYRFTSRAQEFGSFQEGVRAAIIDKDRKPNWQFEINAVPKEIINEFFKPIQNFN